MIQKSSSSNPNHFQDAQECSYVLSPHPPKYVMMMLLHKIAGNCRIYARNWISTKQHADKGLHPTMAKLFKSSSQSLMFENVYLANFTVVIFGRYSPLKWKTRGVLASIVLGLEFVHQLGLWRLKLSEQRPLDLTEYLETPYTISFFVANVEGSIFNVQNTGNVIIETMGPLGIKRLNQERKRQQRLFIGFGDLEKKC